MCALPSSSEVEKEKQRLSTAMFSGLQFMPFSTIESSGSSVFPPNLAQIPLFNQQWSYWSALQQQLLQSLQHQSPQSRSGLF
uniref:Dof-type domain-containing protein n=1 Tax=Syphacia muris TaxID=451379 RepID=A0A0N5ARC2_9BILA